MPGEPERFSKTAADLIASLRRLPNEEPEKMRLRPTQSLGKLVEELAVKHAIGRSSPEQAIRDQWSTIVGPTNAQYSHPAQIDPRGRLLILAHHAVVRNELFLHRRTIVEKVRALTGCGHVREIVLRAG